MEIKRDEGKGCAKRGCERGRERWDAETWPKTVREPTSYTHTHHPEARGGELRNRLGSLYRALCQKERVEKSTTAF